MLSNRSLLLAAACTLPFSIVACSGGDDGGGDGTNAVPTGTHYGYVVNKATVVSSSPTDIGLDLGGPTSATLDTKVDNRLGQALNTLAGFFDIQGTIDTAVAQGKIILLADVQTTDFTNNTTGAGLAIKFGANPVPAACTDMADITCGHHLAGGAMFSIAADSPSDASLAGKVVNGTFTAGPGNVTLQIALGTTTPIELSLLHARAKATGITATGVSSLIVGGVLTMSDLTTKVGPAIKAAVDSLIATDCVASQGPPKCGCKAGSTGEKVITAIDGDLTGTTKDCSVSVEELFGFPVVAAVLTPDSCSKDSCTAADSLSIGVKVTAVAAKF